MAFHGALFLSNVFWAIQRGRISVGLDYLCGRHAPYSGS